MLGHRAVAAGYQRAATRLGRAINRYLWNPARDMYVVSDGIRNVVAQDPNVFAVLTHLARGERARKIMTLMNERLRTLRGIADYSPTRNPRLASAVVSPYMGGYHVFADYLTGHVLGVTTTSPGFRTFRIEPKPSGLKWARGRVPTPHGPIDVQWSLRACRLRVTVDVPHGTTGRVILPDGKRVQAVAEGRHVLVGRACS